MLERESFREEQRGVLRVGWGVGGKTEGGICLSLEIHRGGEKGVYWAPGGPSNTKVIAHKVIQTYDNLMGELTETRIQEHKSSAEVM